MNEVDYLRCDGQVCSASNYTIRYNWVRSPMRYSKPNFGKAIHPDRVFKVP